LEASYNLLDEPWLPVRTEGGQCRGVGIAEALLKAHEIAELRHQSPLVTVSLLRLLIVVLRDAIGGPNDLMEWGKLWNKGALPKAKLREYFKKKRDRFDLLHPKRPFFQDAKTDRTKTLDVMELFQDRTTGTQIGHFSHDSKGRHAVCPACCAQRLTTVPAFCTQGGQGKSPGVNNAPPVYAILNAENLLQTLVVNMPTPGIASCESARDGPVWEGVRKTSSPIGCMEGLTWLPRKILLMPEADTGSDFCTVCGVQSNTLVSRIVFAKGRSRKNEANRDWVDPHVPLTMRRKDVESLRPPHARKARWGFPAFWRTLYKAAFLTLEPTLGVPVLNQLRRAVDEKHVAADPRFTLMCAGLGSSQAKLMTSDHWRWSFSAGSICDDAERWRLLLHLALVDALIEQAIKNMRGLPAKIRAVRDFERAAMEAFGNRALLSAEGADGGFAAHIVSLARAAFGKALPAQGAYSARKGRRNSADHAYWFGRSAEKVIRAATEGGDE
jgi:CRISPR system Cascade subunit CasA